VKEQLDIKVAESYEEIVNYEQRSL